MITRTISLAIYQENISSENKHPQYTYKITGFNLKNSTIEQVAVFSYKLLCGKLHTDN